jgi:hypothetical protein
MHAVHEFPDKEVRMKQKKKVVPPQAPATLLKMEDVKIEIAPIQFKDAKEMRKAFDQTHEEVQKASAAAVDKQSDVLIALAKMRSLLSQRGSEKMRKEANIDSSVNKLAKPNKVESIWMAYFKWYKQTYNLKMCLRTAINKMDLLMGKKLCTECKKEKGHTPSCPKYKEPKPKHLTPLEAKLIDATSYKKYPLQTRPNSKSRSSPRALKAKRMLLQMPPRMPTTFSMSSRR